MENRIRNKGSFDTQFVKLNEFHLFNAFLMALVFLFGFKSELLDMY